MDAGAVAVGAPTSEMASDGQVAAQLESKQKAPVTTPATSGGSSGHSYSQCADIRTCRWPTPCDYHNMSFNIMEGIRAPREWAAMPVEDVSSKEADAIQITSASDSATNVPATPALSQVPSPRGADVSPTAVHDNPLLRPHKRNSQHHTDHWK